jgi:AbrB family looped-hinge helix DNA binding protein
MATHDSTLEYLATTKIGEKGQITVPKQFRDDLGLENGSPFAVLRIGDGLILVPEQQRFERLCQEMSSILTSAGVTREDFLGTLPEIRDQLYARRYGKKRGTVAKNSRPRNRRKK